MEGCLQITTTTGDRETAQRIASELVDRRLAACVQLTGPVESVYRWQGKIERSEEWLCIAKTTAGRFPAIEALIAELHPYDVPELIATPIVGGSAAYLAWVREQAGGESATD